MNQEVPAALTKIMDDDRLSREFLKLENMDDMYDYCQKIESGYSEEEFDESIAELIEHLDRHGAEEISEKDLGAVAGGFNVKSTVSKTMAAVLSALAIGSATGLPNAFAAGTSSVRSSTPTMSSSQKVSGKWEKTKEALSNFYKNHKTAIWATTTVAALAGAGALAYKDYNKYQALEKEVDRLKQNASRMSTSYQSQREQAETQLRQVETEKTELLVRNAHLRQDVEKRSQIIEAFRRAAPSAEEEVRRIIREEEQQRKKAQQQTEPGDPFA